VRYRLAGFRGATLGTAPIKLLAAALLLTPFLGLPAWSGPIPDGGITREEMAAALKQQDLDSQFAFDRDGNPLVESTLEGVKFYVYFYDCGEKLRCKFFQFAAPFAVDAVPVATIMEWNRTKRFGRSHLDKEGHPWVKMEVDVEHGTTTEALENDVDRWKAVLREFGKRLSKK
jgi:hypothetical protein